MTESIYVEVDQIYKFSLSSKSLVEGMIKMMNSKDGVTGPVNHGNPSEFSMLELAEKVIELTESKSKIEYKPLPQDDPTQRKPVIDLAKRELGTLC